MKKIALVFLLVWLTVFLEAKAKVTKIEYLPGDDFVQLFLQTNQIIPIPDVFYPQKGNLRKLVVRIKDAEFQLDKNAYTFNSPVIQDVQLKTSTDFSDLEINLKGDVSYQVRTNQTGLFIEFPIIKSVSSPKPEKPKTETPPSAAPAVTSGTVLKDVRLGAASPERISFELVLSGKPEYTVIPLKDPPVRLAIDLKNTQARKLFKSINSNNVKTVRGSYNSPQVFRVVFDLTELKEFAVRPQGNSLLVEFFATPAPQAKPEAVSPPAATTEPLKTANPQPVVSETVKTEIPKPVISEPPKTETVVVAKPATEPAAKPLAVPEEKPVVQQLQPEKKEPPPTEKKEYFNEDKAKVTTDKPVGGSITVPSEKGQEKTTFVRQTIEQGQTQYSGNPMDFSFKNMELKNLLKQIARLVGLSLMVDPDVSGTITCELYQIPWDQALDLFLKTNGLGKVQEGTVLRVGRIEKLAQEADKDRQLRESREEAGNLEVSTRTLSFAKVSGIRALLEKQLTKRGEINIDERTNTLIISEVPDRIKVIDRLIDTLDAANPQVSIEARIVEATSNYLNSFGIQWGYNLVADSAHGNQTNLVFPNSITSSGFVPQGTAPNKYTFNGTQYGYAVNLPVADTAIYPFFRLGNIANTFNLDVALAAMERKGKGRIISSPKATAQNNMKAKLTQGERIPIQTVQNNTVTTQYVNAALEMEVTPQITARGSVIMEINIKNDIANFDKQVLGIPTITTETAETTVQVIDGGTIVIGGLYKISETQNADSVPLISKIPLLGSLFKNSKKTGAQNELLIFITPRIIK